MSLSHPSTDVLASKLRQAVGLHQQGHLVEAQAVYREILRLRPGHFDALHLLGVTAAQLKQPEQSLELIDQAIAIDPRHAQTHYNRGLALKALQRLDAALTSFERALAIEPNFAAAHFERGLLLNESGRMDAALASYDHAISVKQDYAEAHYNRALVLRQLQQFSAAIQSYSRAISVRQEYAKAYTGRAVTALLCGDFSNGWADYEWRWKEPSSAREWRTFAQPRWLGKESLRDRSILLHGEQGLGDSLQFCRYASSVAAQGARVMLEVPRPLVRLLSSLDGVDRVLPRGTTLPQFDVHCPLMSLPLAFGTSLSTIPARVPYLRCDPENFEQWRQRLGPRRKLRVGVVWSGGFRPDQPDCWAVNEQRNVALARLAPLRHADIEFFSLQKGQPAESELAELRAANWDGPQLLRLGDQFTDFVDTASVVQQMDLIISVDTSTAHLAGALGKPVWIMNRFDTCWRWLLDRPDSPWYPTARLYRQERAGHWDTVVERIRKDLFGLVSTSRTA